MNFELAKAASSEKFMLAKHSSQEGSKPSAAAAKNEHAKRGGQKNVFQGARKKIVF